MKVGVWLLLALLPISAHAGEVYSYAELQRMATAFVDTYEDLIENNSAATNTEMLMLSSEFKGYVGAYLDYAQRGEDLSQSRLSQCLFDNTFEEIALNSSYLLIDMKPIEAISAVENFTLAVQAFCDGRLRDQQQSNLLTSRLN